VRRRARRSAFGYSQIMRVGSLDNAGAPAYRAWRVSERARGERIVVSMTVRGDRTNPVTARPQRPGYPGRGDSGRRPPVCVFVAGAQLPSQQTHLTASCVSNQVVNTPVSRPRNTAYAFFRRPISPAGENGNDVRICAVDRC
jgi:hypothetical protein